MYSSRVVTVWAEDGGCGVSWRSLCPEPPTAACDGNTAGMRKSCGFVLLPRARGLSTGWALAGLYQVTGDWQCGEQSWRGDLAIFERYAFWNSAFWLIVS